MLAVQPQPPERCLSRKAKIVRCCLKRYEGRTPQQYRDNPHGAYESQEGGGHDGQ